MIRPLAHIAALSPYALADLQASSDRAPISLSQNESLRPPSPRAVEAAKKASADAHLYPDPDWTDLRGGLAELHGIPSEQILCGCGSLDLIGCLARAYVNSQSAVLAPAHAYPFFRSVSEMAGARFDTAPESGTSVSVDSLLSSVRPDTRIVFVANPGNPTGTRLPKDEFQRLRASLPDDLLLVIDEAYGEFADHLGERNFDMVECGSTVVLRTFSKAYGLAGMRVGWGLFPLEIARELRKVMNPNNISAVAQAAAMGALEDQVYMNETCQRTSVRRDSFIKLLRTAGFELAESFTNFVLIPFRDAEEAQRADKMLKAEGIVLRGQGGAGLDHALRATIGSEAVMQRTATLLAAFREENTA